MLDFVIKSKRVYIQEELVEAYVGVKDEKIVYIGKESPGKATREMDAGDHMVLPGMADSHVHFREPGNAHRETFFTGTSAAANGGITTVCEHPLSSPPPYTMEILKRRHAATEGELLTDIAFMGAAGEHNIAALVDFANTGEIIAYKTFLHAPIKGREIEFEGLTMCNDGVIYEGIQELAKTGIPWLVHAENNDMIQHNTTKFKREGKTTAIYHAKSRPPISEIETVAKLLLLTEEKDVPILFCHISTPEACELVKQARQRGRHIYLETCPHYLMFTEDLLQRFGSYAKCSPPLRTERERNALWKYIEDGTIDIIGSDHAPYARKEKENDDIFQASAGFPSIEVRFPIMFTQMLQGKLSLKKLVDLMTTNIAKIFRLYPQKGAIMLGADADFIVVDDKKTYKFAARDLYSKSKESGKMFEGMEVTGQIMATVLRGHVIKENGVVCREQKGIGKILRPMPRRVAKR